MNIAEIFVRRPVMTVLVMAGILIFGIIAYRLLPVNATSERRFSDYPGVGAACPARAPDDHGLGGGDAARKAVLDHRRASTR